MLPESLIEGFRVHLQRVSELAVEQSLGLVCRDCAYSIVFLMKTAKATMIKDAGKREQSEQSVGFEDARKLYY
jgi:hypothetical protein